MSELPSGWATAEIGHICSLKNGRAFKTSEWSSKGIPIVRIQNLNNPDGKYNFFEGSFEPRYHLKGGELLFAWSGTPGTSFGAHIWQGEEAVLNQHIFRVDFDERILDKRFFRHAINQKLDELIGGAHGGVGLRHVTKGAFEETEITIPPISEQKRIADKLEAVLGRVDACRTRLDRVPSLLKRFRQSVLAAATSGQLTADWRKENPADADGALLANAIRYRHEAAGGHKTGNAAPPSEDVHDLVPEMFPNGWHIMTLRELVAPDRPITYGILKPGPELESGVPYVRVADFPNDCLNLDTIRKTSKEMDEQFKRSRLRAGDILMSIRGTVGRLIVIPPELEGANITQDSARLSIQPEVSTAYVLWYLRSSMAQNRMQLATKGVAVRGINIGDVRALQVPLPSVEEQQEIVCRVEALFAFANRIEARLATAQKAVERLTPAVLAKAFRGELVPQDPNDEPASDLLARLRATPSQVSVPHTLLEVVVPKRPRAPKQNAAMTKSRFDDDVKDKPYLAGLLQKTPYPQDATELFKVAGLSLVDFYKQLSWEVEHGMIRENAEELEAVQ